MYEWYWKAKIVIWDTHKDGLQSLLNTLRIMFSSARNSDAEFQCRLLSMCTPIPLSSTELSSKDDLARKRRQGAKKESDEHQGLEKAGHIAL